MNTATAIPVPPVEGESVGASVNRSALVDKHLDAVLRASGSALRNYSMPSSLEAMRAAMREAMREGGNV